MDKRKGGCDQGRVKRPLPDLATALLFLAAGFLVRLPVLHRSVLDWDESLYFLMARAWRHGALPYGTIWDNKPIGIYAIFALFQDLFGDMNVVGMRVAASLFLGVLAFAVFKIVEALTQQRVAAWVAGVAALVCGLTNDGLSANTELFMASFTALAVLAVYQGRSGLLVGVLLGCAFMIKYVSVFEAPVIFGLFLIRRPRLGAGMAVLAGAALPLLATIALYAAAGRLPLWWDCAVAANARRVSEAVGSGAFFAALHQQAWRWGPLYLGGLAILVRAVAFRRGADIFLGLWFLGGLVGVASARSFYDHYFLQLLPVLCVALGVWVARLPPGLAWRAAFVAAMLALPAWSAATTLRWAAGRDEVARAAVLLRAAGAKSLYVFDSQPILYALTGTVPPTRYVLPSELVKNFLPQVAGVRPVPEVARILATAPEFLVRRDPPPRDPREINLSVYAELDAALAAHYRLWAHLPGIAIFKHR